MSIFAGSRVTRWLRLRENLSKRNKKIEILEKQLGVKLTIDPTFDKFSKVMPEKMQEREMVLANIKL